MLTRYQTIAYALLAGTLLLSACSKKAPTASTPGSPPADINSFFNALPQWAQFSPLAQDTNAASGAPILDSSLIGGEEHECTTTPYSITSTPEDIVTLNPDVEVLWLGGLIQGDGYSQGIGSLQSLPVGQRNPISITIDFLTGNAKRVVQAPSQGNVNNAIGEMVNQATLAGHKAGSSIFFSKEEMFSFDQVSLSMGMSAKYTTQSVKASMSTNLSSEKRTVTAYFVHQMFTASMEQPQFPGDLFSPEFTQEALQKEIDLGRMSASNPPVYVSSVTYGRILMFSMTSDASVADIQAAIEFSIDAGTAGGDASLEAKLSSINQSAQIQIVTVGGDANNALASIRSSSLGAYFDENAALTTGKPISYTLRDLKSNNIAKVSETTQYSLTQCLPAAQPITGAEYRIQFTRMKGETIRAPWDDTFGLFDFEIYYALNVQDDYQGVQPAAVYNSSNPFVYAFKLKKGQTVAIKNSQSKKVKVHFDGRDQMRIFGSIWDASLVPDPVVGRLDVSWKWPGRPLPAGSSERSVLLRHTLSGSEIRLYFSITKVADLTD